MVRMEIFDDHIPVFGHADERTLNQIRVCARTADKVALMPDNHVGYGVPIGGVVAYKDAISPTGVGYDIGCGNKAVRVDMPGAELRAWVDRAGIELRGAGLDESPDCYKRLDEVLEAVGDTVRILHRLTPVGVAMAGANEFDPYKD